MSSGGQKRSFLAVNFRDRCEFDENIGSLAGKSGFHSREEPQGEIFDILRWSLANGITLRILICCRTAREVHKSSGDRDLPERLVESPPNGIFIG